MSEKSFFKKAVSCITIFIVTFILSLTAHTNSYAQYNLYYEMPWNLSYNSYVTPYYNLVISWNSFYPIIPSNYYKPKVTSPAPKPTEPEEIEKVISTIKVKSAELTGDMILDFDEERPVGIPRNYDYYLLDGEIYPDIKAYTNETFFPDIFQSKIGSKFLV